MALNLYLDPGSPPAGTALPGNAQALLDFISAYTGIAGGANFNGVNFGENTPSPDNRDKPWFQTDQNGNPVGFFAWNGIAWVAIPVNLGNGPTANRPANPSTGSTFFDTTINVALVFERGQWRTMGGSPGDLKEVTAPDITTAITNNPGWIQHAASVGLVIGGAGDATGITAAHAAGSILGEENHVLTINELAPHTHTTGVGGNRITADGNAANPGGIIPSGDASVTGSTGGGAGHNTLQPTQYFFRLVKQ